MYGYIYKITLPYGSFNNSEGEPFYIGQKKSDVLDDAYYGSGTKISDWFRSKGFKSSNCKKSDAEKLGVKKEILKIAFSQEELDNLEYEEIHKVLNENLCLNLCDGGHRGIATIELKEKISKNTKKAMEQPEVYKKYKENHSRYFRDNKEFISKQSKERAEKTGNLKLGTKKAAEINKEITKNEILREQRRKKKIESWGLKKVKCIETGEVFDNANNASTKTKIRHIDEVCQGFRKTAGGFHWEYI